MHGEMAHPSGEMLKKFHVQVKISRTKNDGRNNRQVAQAHLRD